VAPAVIESAVEVGQSTSRSIQITNTNEIALPVSIAVQSAIVDGEPIDGTFDERFDVSGWISFDQETYILKPKERTEIPFNITPPFTAQSGGHYALISVRGLALDDELSSQRGLVFPEVGVPVLITVPGEVTQQARIAEDRLFPTFATPGDTLSVRVPIENTGAVHNLVSAKIVVRKDDSVIDEFALPSSLILPGIRKYYETKWTTPEYGSYEVNVEMLFGSQQEIVNSEPQTVRILPSLYSLALLAFSIWLSLYIYPRRRNLRRAINIIRTGE
jgi:hypothetical protein